MISIYKDNTIKTRVYSGGTSESLIEMAKKTLLFDVMRNHTELVTDRRAYPVDEEQKIHLTTDFVILTREEYNNLLNGNV